MKLFAAAVLVLTLLAGRAGAVPNASSPAGNRLEREATIEAPQPNLGTPISRLAEPEPLVQPRPVLAPQSEHAFYDRAGKIELTVASVLAAVDTAQTCHNLATGGRENWLPTQHCPQVTLILGGQVAIQEAAAYFLHRTHHHKLERLTRLYSMEENSRALVYSFRHGAW